jgi:hypothetical protein
MTVPKSIIISKKDSKSIKEFKRKLAKRDNLKIIRKSLNQSKSINNRAI